MSSELLSSLPSSQRLNIINSYFAELYDDEIETAMEIADEIEVEGPLADTVVIIPVAAHQEAGQIANTMAEYARQKPERPFSIVLGLNCPRDYQFFPEARLTQMEVKAAQDRHSDLDIRYIFKPYEEPVIGQVRRDLWNGVLFSALRNKQIDTEKTVIGLNQDIDLVSMWPTSIKAIQHEIDEITEDGSLVPVLGMSMVHGKSPKHPNINRAVTWHDFVIVQMGETFEAGLVISAEAYAISGGINEKSSYQEVFSKVGGPAIIVPGAYATTSPRRYLERMHDDGLNVWRKDNFLATEKYRQTDNFPDISFEESIGIIDKTIPSNAKRIGRSVVQSIITDCRVLKREETELFDSLFDTDDFVRMLFETRIKRKQLVGTRVLNKLSGDSELGEKFTSHLPMDVAVMTERIYNALMMSFDPDHGPILVKLS